MPPAPTAMSAKGVKRMASWPEFGFSQFSDPGVQGGGLADLSRAVNHSRIIPYNIVVHTKIIVNVGSLIVGNREFIIFFF